MGAYTPKPLNFKKKTTVVGARAALQLNEIERASSHFKTCPKCNSAAGFWIGLKRERAHVQCKACGAKFELFRVYKASEQRKPAERFSFLK